MGGMKILAAICAASCTAFAVAREISVAPTDDFEKVFARLQGERKVGDPVEIVFEDGIHALRSCIVLGKADSGLVFRARNPGKAILVGGLFLTGADFKPLPSEGKLRAWDVPKNLRGPLGNIWDGEPILLVDLAVRPMARWPNGGYVAIPETGAGREGRHLNVFDRRMEGWCGGIVSKLRKSKNVGGEDELGLDSEEAVSGPSLDEKVADCDLPGNALGFFGMIGTYASGGGRGYFTSELGVTTIKFPARPAAGCPVYFYGLMEELDEPGEWCYDRRAHRLLLWPDADMTDASSVVVATRSDGFVRLEGATDIVLEGLTFAAHARGKVALDFGRSDRCRIEGCRFVGLGDQAIAIGGRFNRVQSCDFTDVEGCCIRLSGGDRLTQRPGSNVVDNCFFERPCAKRIGFSVGAIDMDGVDNTVSHCLIRNTREHAMNWGGYGCIVEYCRMYNASTEFRDSAVVYAPGGPRSYGCHFRFNDISGSPDLCHGIYADDCSPGHRIYGNVVRNVGWGGIFIGGGRDNVISNNVIHHAGWMALHTDNRGLVWPTWKDGVEHFRRVEVPYLGLGKPDSAFVRRFPRILAWERDGTNVYGNIDNEWVNNIVVDGVQTQDQVDFGRFVPLDRQVSRGNLGIGCAQPPVNGIWRYGGFKLVDATATPDRLFRRLPKRKLVKRKVGFDYYIYDKGDFNLAENSIIPKECPGFVPIPWDRIGLYRDRWRMTLPHETCQMK